MAIEKYEILSARRSGGKRALEWRTRVVLKNLCLLCVLSNAAYIFCRAWTTTVAKEQTLAGWITLLVEAGLSLPHLLACLHEAGMCAKFSGWRRSLRLSGPNVPLVDIFITYCGEGIDVLLDTVNATVALDYPRDRFHIYVLDDCGADGAEEALQPVRKQFGNLHYECRGEKVTTHSKAANLNFGVSKSRAISNAEFLAVLDVDMIPEPCWLRAMLPHVLQDESVAMSNPPQDFYNVPRSDVLGMSFEFRWISDVLMPMQDCTGKSWCTGSGFVVRRKAINDIDGFPTETLQEDVLTSTLLSGRGWKTVHVHEVVQWGLSPTGIAGILKQRARMAAGIVAVALLSRSPKGKEKIAHQQRVDSIVIAVMYSLAAIIIGVSSVVVPALMLTGFQLVHFKTRTQMLACLWLGLFDCACQLTYGLVESSLSDYRLPILNRFKGMWSVPHRVVSVVRTLLHDGDTHFKPTGLSLATEEHLHKQSIWKRLKYIFFDCALLGHFLVFAACLVAVWRSFIGFSPTQDSLSATLATLLTRLGWPPLFLFWTSVMSNAWVPLAYGFFTPAPTPRASLLVQRPGSNAVMPSAEAKANDEQRVSQWQAIWVTAWTISVGVLCLLRLI